MYTHDKMRNDEGTTVNSKYVTKNILCFMTTKSTRGSGRATASYESSMEVDAGKGLCAIKALVKPELNSTRQSAVCTGQEKQCQAIINPACMLNRTSAH
jgi:hypothetical protein